MGTLYIVATPIGNLEDITIRAIKTLFTVDYIACEDTRVTGRLLSLLKQRFLNREVTIKDLAIDKKPALISYFDEIEEQKAPEVIGLLENGHDVALVSDAGTPLISDPGFKLVKLAIKQGANVVPIPGPSSILAALTASGLPSHDFRFLGYLSSKHSLRITQLKSILTDSVFTQTKARHRYQFEAGMHKSYDSRPLGHNYTIILFEAAQRVKRLLSDIREIFGDKDIVLSRELTKIHEEFIRGKISEITEKKFTYKGEFVVLFSS